MRHSPLIVLKFGGSVLTSETTIRRAVHEVYRWRREGWRVAAVVSAIAGETDALLDTARRACPDATPASVSGLASLGESRSAALLALALDRAGVPCAVLSPAAVGLCAAGDPRDAEPVDLDRAHFDMWFQREHTVIVPGFFGVDQLGRTVTFGRGGSDLTALHLAHSLGAQCCRLIKDVDGLYVSDPAQPGPEPLRYQYATYDDALATDGSIIQHKAVRYAAKRRLTFEIGRLNGSNPTCVGPGTTIVSHTHDRPQIRRVALLGLGTVGLGVYDLLCKLTSDVAVTAVAAQDPSKLRSLDVPAELFTDPFEAMHDADLVVELVGGLDVARQVVFAALDQGVSVVTANKALIASDGQRIADLADARGAAIRYSASVGGSVPVLERIAARHDVPLCSVRGILNGTTNFILDQIAHGHTLESAIKAAKALGFAESDPSRDLNNIDAAEKLCVIARHACSSPSLSLDDIQIESLEDGLSRLGLPDAERELRVIASLKITPGARAIGRVALERLYSSDPLSAVRGAGNAVELFFEDGSREVINGLGAGRWPTAEAVVADVLAVCRETRFSGTPAHVLEAEHA